MSAVKHFPPVNIIQKHRRGGAFCDENDDGETDCRECMRAAAKIVLLVINTIWVLVGLGMCIGGGVAYTWASKFSGLIDTTSIIVVSVVGGFLLFVGILGFYSVFHLGCKSLQFVYGLLVLALAIAMAAAGAAILSYLGVVGSNATGLASANRAQEEARYRIDNYINCMHEKCCILSNSSSTRRSLVTATTPSASDAQCDGSKAGNIQPGICLSLDEVKIRDCTSSTAFKKGIQAYITGYLSIFMMAVFGVAGLQFIGFMIACCFVLTEYTGGDSITPYTA